MVRHRIRPLVVSFFLLCCVSYQPDASAADDYQEGSRLLKEGKLAEALEHTEVFIAQHPKDARARFLKGVILTEQNKTQDAIAVFTELTQDYPELPEPYNNLAVLYAGQGDYEKARRALEMAIRTHPSYAVAHENLGDLYATMASQAYDKALQLDTNNATARKKLALIKELFPTKTAATLAKAEPEKPAAEPVKPEAVTSAAPAPAVSTAPPVPPAAPPALAPAAAAPPKPAVEVKPAASTAPPAEDQTAAVLRMVNSWTKAWSSNDANAYLSFYAPQFRTPDGEPRQEWEANRRARLAKPKKIHVIASSPRVRFTDKTHAVVTFRQNYSSATLKATGTKTLHLVRIGDRWLIEQELVEK
ncbi:MAG TPA: tetratricopeptide repeat protein [Burkholderiales bacterium]|nr:tetratricopeptide repeat protein [Burkholderiales bacterium]